MAFRESAEIAGAGVEPDLLAGIHDRPGFDILRRTLRGRLAIPGALIVALAVFCAVAAPVITPYQPSAPNPTALRARPSATHPFGTDQFGRDVLSRTIQGARTSMAVGTLSALLIAVIGVPLGLISGYFGHIADQVIMRSMDAMLTFPSLILALALVIVLGPGPRNVIVAIAATFIPVIARLARAQTLQARELEYVSAAKSLGARAPRVIIRHILPSVQAAIVVQLTLIVAFAMLAEASLSFLGIGVKPATPTWGVMLKDAYPLMSIAPWMAVAPGVALFLVALSFNLLGDALRDALDPRLRYGAR